MVCISLLCCSNSSFDNLFLFEVAGGGTFFPVLAIFADVAPFLAYNGLIEIALTNTPNKPLSDFF